MIGLSSARKKVGPAFGIGAQTSHVDDQTDRQDKRAKRPGEGPRARINEVVIVFDGAASHGSLLPVSSGLM
jgi:hypothetical protein